MKLPKKITPCPILEAALEIRFESDTPPDAIFGIVYNTFKDSFPKCSNLPILQIPEPIRMQDKNLIYKPYHKLQNKNLNLQAGPKVFSLTCVNDYLGWESFSNKAKECFLKIKELNLYNEINRLGIRYINFFDFDIFDKIDLNISIKNNKLKFQEIYFRTKLETDQFLSQLQITNNAEIKNENQMKKGSVIDIDTVFEKRNIDMDEILNKLLDEGHLKEKEVFFNLLQEKFLKNLNPKY